MHKEENTAQVAPMTPIQAMHPLQFVTMDYLTIENAMGYENILVVIDHFTKHIQQRIKRWLQQPSWH